ncbi:uncharacterized protein LOC110718727 [Chenopodium quinoa]|uniref:uncharacterized protein LOC110718727 n=1 Tax=Chenopodium quinoa TaxID=63459 RepID=UPI000B78ABA0|nr:uncharacterized protein LOC110718727 [Chenopodium quinoa]
MASHLNLQNSNTGDGDDHREGGRRRPGIPQPTPQPKPKKELSKIKRQRALQAKILESIPFHMEQPPSIESLGARTSGATAGVPTVLDMLPQAPQPKKNRLEHQAVIPSFLIRENKVEPKIEPTVGVRNHPQPVTSVGDNIAPPPPPPIPELKDKQLPDIDLNETIPTENGQAVVLSIIVRSYTLGDVGVMYNIQTDETFEAIYKDYASRIDVKPEKIKLYNGGTHIPSSTYPEPFGVDTGSVLYVQGMTGVVNTNTRTKRFYLKNTGKRNKKKLRVQGKLDSPLYRLFHIWGDKFEVDPTDLVFYHEDKLVCTLETIREVGIKNGDKVYVAPHKLE